MGEIGTPPVCAASCCMTPPVRGIGAGVTWVASIFEPDVLVAAAVPTPLACVRASCIGVIIASRLFTESSAVVVAALGPVVVTPLPGDSAAPAAPLVRRRTFGARPPPSVRPLERLAPRVTLVAGAVAGPSLASSYAARFIVSGRPSDHFERGVWRAHVTGIGECICD